MTDLQKFQRATRVFLVQLLRGWWPARTPPAGAYPNRLLPDQLPKSGGSGKRKDDVDAVTLRQLDTASLPLLPYMFDISVPPGGGIGPWLM